MSVVNRLPRATDEFILPSHAINLLNEDCEALSKIVKDMSNDSDNAEKYHEEFLRKPLHVVIKESKAKNANVYYYKFLLREGEKVYKPFTPPCEINLYGVRSPAKRVYEISGKSQIMAPSLSFKGDTAVTCHIGDNEYPNEPLGDLFVVYGEFLKKYAKYRSTYAEHILHIDDEVVKTYLPCPIPKKSDDSEKDPRNPENRYVTLKFNRVNNWDIQPYHKGDLNQYIGGSIKIQKSGKMISNRNDLRDWTHVIMTESNVHEYITGGHSLLTISWGEYIKSANGWSTKCLIYDLEMNCTDVQKDVHSKHAESVGARIFGRNKQESIPMNPVCNNLVKESDQDDDNDDDDDDDDVNDINNGDVYVDFEKVNELLEKHKLNE